MLEPIKRTANALERLKQRHYAVLGIAVGVLATFLTTAWTGSAPGTVLLAALFFIVLACFFAAWLLSYRSMVISLRQSRRVGMQVARLHRELVAKEASFSDYKHHVEVSDLAFRSLALDRTEFDNDLVARANRPSPNRESEMAEALEKYLVNCCNRAIDIFAARNQVQRDTFQANIKIFRKERGKFEYRAIARSRNTSDHRRQRDSKWYEVASNYVIEQCLHDAKRLHVVTDVHQTIATYGNINRDYTAPTRQAGDFYRSSMTILLFIKPQTADQFEGVKDSKNVMRNAFGDRIRGCISIDSSSYGFSRENKEDLGILEEISINALSAIVLHGKLSEMVSAARIG